MVLLKTSTAKNTFQTHLFLLPTLVWSMTMDRVKISKSAVRGMEYLNFEIKIGVAYVALRGSLTLNDGNTGTGK